MLQHEHVYALDGPTPWLSIDVRVARVPRGVFLAGRQNNDPIPFVQGVVDRFRQLPTDEFHPFLQLSTDPDVSRLELSPTVSGVQIDNFAFAKVRFRTERHPCQRREDVLPAVYDRRDRYGL